ncbi:hypothetical protein DPMN_165601 [Dreissena polymorpha]|uniref:Uncharacterized protein n=1 Tax=Dreissena polymorpha TaxID=45954 RepID=A0A9D4IWS2_DREPO|nr:hypothetical protein DPMN_165601 [Dreissena polymorpha]
MQETVYAEHVRHLTGSPLGCKVPILANMVPDERSPIWNEPDFERRGLENV